MPEVPHIYTNSLIHESSPYLLQHAHNPVHWFPWHTEILAKAQQENKPIILSIGYAACHWCHVMEHESFEDPEVAEIMNSHFISIKVDREERPDVDQVYMSAVQLMTGRGGWPLNCILLPDGRPIFGGTYFPREQWKSLLLQLSTIIEENPNKTEEQASRLTKAIREMDYAYAKKTNNDIPPDLLGDIISNWKQSFDYKYGGTIGSPKFPLPIGWNFLLRSLFWNHDDEVEQIINTTLTHMACGGIYDQIGGGFARYSVDDRWFAPHFEKMLYDNAQLVSLYCLAYSKSENPLYKNIVTETLEFVNREWTTTDGVFYSALDADSEGEEGKYYTWTSVELDEILKNNSSIVKSYYHVTEKGNWERGQNILHTPINMNSWSESNHTTPTLIQTIIQSTNQILHQEREKRIPPAKDTKIITSWNAMMAKAYIDAAMIFRNENYLSTARKCIEFITSQMSLSHQLYRLYAPLSKPINGFLDDYAFLISALISMYQATFEESFLQQALDYMEYTLLHFYDEESSMFFYTSDLDDKLITRKMEITDNVIPSSNSEMAKNLYLLSIYFRRDHWLNISQDMLSAVSSHLSKGEAYYSNWDILLSWNTYPIYEVVITGNEALSFAHEISSHFLPQIILSGSYTISDLPILKDKPIHEKTTIYICQGTQCLSPSTNIQEVIKFLKKPVYN